MSVRVREWCTIELTSEFHFAGCEHERNAQRNARRGRYDRGMAEGGDGRNAPHPTNQRGTSPNRPFQNGGGGAPRKATPAQNGPTHPRTQRNFSVCLKQIAAIKIANAMAAEYSRAQEISLICQACSSSPASGHPADVRRGPRR